MFKALFFYLICSVFIFLTNIFSQLSNDPLVYYCRIQSSNVTNDQASSPSSESQNAQAQVNKQQRLDTDLHSLWHGTVANITLSRISSFYLLHHVGPFPSILPTNLPVSRHFFPLHRHQLHRWWQCSTFCCWIHRLCDSTICCLFVFRGGELFL